MPVTTYAHEIGLRGRPRKPGNGDFTLCAIMLMSLRAW